MSSVHLQITILGSTQLWRETPNKDINALPIPELLTSRPKNMTHTNAQTGSCWQQSITKWRPA
jgi:hypothetical protein